ncbi:hypothetical protein WU87_01925 [Corynebacterium minutissimum]|uniref:Uncharacterized protein n=1 Tax=Corynebacterium minutissimum TaxID=38301 RepID=A0ACC4UD55_9CORY|nr:hypothetical protein WU87_01925 [Corynebacterium minutissimum]
MAFTIQPLLVLYRTKRPISGLSLFLDDNAFLCTRPGAISFTASPASTSPRLFKQRQQRRILPRSQTRTRGRSLPNAPMETEFLSELRTGLIDTLLDGFKAQARAD